jgi:hypothetical protein
MRRRRVLLCLPERPSEDVLALAEAIKAVTALRPTYPVRFYPSVVDETDDDRTPVDIQFGTKPLVLRIEDPPDGGEGVKEDADEDRSDD